MPKTGGTTFAHQLDEKLKEEETLSTSQIRYSLIDPRINKDKIKVILGHASYYGIHKLFPNRKPRYIVFLRDPAERMVSSYNFEMRFKKGKNISFWKWYRSQLKNEMVHFLDMKFRGKEGTKLNLPPRTFKFFLKPFSSQRVYMFLQSIFAKGANLFYSSKKTQRKKLENAKRLLNNCWHIGFVSDLNKSLKYLFNEIGVSTEWKDHNVTKENKRFFTLDEESRKKLYKDNLYDKELFDYAVAKSQSSL